MSKIKVQERGKNPISLEDKDYLSGGEGKVFVRGDIAYKIYHDSKQVIPEAKIQELQPIVGSNVLGPKNMLYNPSNGNPIGFTMQYVSGTIALAQLFTTSFRDRNGVTPEMSVKLVQKMIEVTQKIHENNILIIDGNEFNYLVDEKTLIDPYFIDVDSYQTKSYPAKVLMPSVKDWHTKGFTPESDWFSFSVIATQIFIGIHPYKGTHPNFARGDMEARMKNNASIFDKNVSLPPAARSFDLIPGDLRSWLVDILQNGKRCLPPMLVVGKINKPQITVIATGNNQFTINLIESCQEPVFGCDYVNGCLVIYTTNSIKIGKINYSPGSKTAGVIQPINCTNPLVVDLVNGSLSIVDSRKGNELCKNKIIAQKKMIFDNRIYVLNDDKLSEINITKLGEMIIPSYGKYWTILPKASKIFRGFIYSDVLGSPHFYIPYDKGSMGIFKIDELKGYRIIDAKYENKVCILLVSTKKTGKYDRFIFKFNFEQQKYVFEHEQDVLMIGVNFTTLDNGVVVLNDGDSIIAFHNSISNTTRKIIHNSGIDPSAALFKNGNQVYFYLHGKVCSLSMK